jgi:hypothetical protein
MKALLLIVWAVGIGWIAWHLPRPRLVQRYDAWVTRKLNEWMGDPRA